MTGDDTDSSSSSSSSATMAWASQVLLFAMTLFLSATVSWQQVCQRLFGNPRAWLVGVLLQYTVLPWAGCATVALVRHWSTGTATNTHVDELWTPAMGLTLLVLTASPGGAYSTWWCAQCRADVALSVAMTTLSSAVGIVLLPLNLALTARVAYADPANHDDGNDNLYALLDLSLLFQSLCLVLLAIGLGLGLGYLYRHEPALSLWANRLANGSGLGLVVLGLVTAAQTSSGASTDLVITGYDGTASSAVHDSPMDTADDPSWWATWALYVGAVGAPCLIGLVLPHVVARHGLGLTLPETAAIAIECCYQNNGIATAVALAMFPTAAQRAQAVAVPLVYGVVEAVLIAFYAAWVRPQTLRPDEKATKPTVAQSRSFLSDEDEDALYDDDVESEFRMVQLSLSPLLVSSEETQEPTQQIKDLLQHQETFETRDTSSSSSLSLSSSSESMAGLIP